MDSFYKSPQDPVFCMLAANGFPIWQRQNDAIRYLAACKIAPFESKDQDSDIPRLVQFASMLCASNIPLAIANALRDAALALDNQAVYEPLKRRTLQATRFFTILDLSLIHI